MSQVVLDGLEPLLDRLGNAFTVADIMIPRSRLRYVAPGDQAAADELVKVWRYSAIPTTSDGGESFHSIFETLGHGTKRGISGERTLNVRDFLPDRTPLAEAVEFFREREWYLTHRGNRVSGMVTYWDLNAREFRIQLFVALSRIEELTRDILAGDGCGVVDDSGLKLSPRALEAGRKRFEEARSRLGGNRFVDALDFHDVQGAVRGHHGWVTFLGERIGSLSKTKYEDRFRLMELRDLVMHG